MDKSKNWPHSAECLGLSPGLVGNGSPTECQHPLDVRRRNAVIVYGMVLHVRVVDHADFAGDPFGHGLDRLAFAPVPFVLEEDPLQLLHHITLTNDIHRL